MNPIRPGRISAPEPNEQVLRAGDLESCEFHELVFSLMDFLDLEALRTNVGYGQREVLIRSKSVAV